MVAINQMTALQLAQYCTGKEKLTENAHAKVQARIQVLAVGVQDDIEALRAAVKDADSLSDAVNYQNLSADVERTVKDLAIAVKILDRMSEHKISFAVKKVMGNIQDAAEQVVGKADKKVLSLAESGKRYSTKEALTKGRHQDIGSEFEQAVKKPGKRARLKAKAKKAKTAILGKIPGTKTRANKAKQAQVQAGLERIAADAKTGYGPEVGPMREGESVKERAKAFEAKQAHRARKAAKAERKEAAAAYRERDWDALRSTEHGMAIIRADIEKYGDLGGIFETFQNCHAKKGDKTPYETLESKFFSEGRDQAEMREMADTALDDLTWEDCDDFLGHMAEGLKRAGYSSDIERRSDWPRVIREGYRVVQEIRDRKMDEE